MIACSKSGATAVIVALALGLDAGAMAQTQQSQTQQSQTRQSQTQQRQSQPPAASATSPPVLAGGSIGNISVVSADQIAATAATDIEPALTLVPTLVFNDSGGPAGLSTLSLRGSTPQQVLVLLDGQRLADVQSAFFNINDLPVPVERIERIEVLPNPASVLYGPDAIGGVVNIVTRPPGLTPGFALSYGRGSEAEQRVAGGVQYGLGKVGLRADGRLHTGDGYRDNGDFDVKNYTVGAAIAPAPWGLDVRWDSFECEAGVPGPTSLPTPNARSDDSLTLLRADFTYLPGGGWDVKTGVFSQSQTQRYTDPDPPEDPALAVAPVVVAPVEGDMLEVLPPAVEPPVPAAPINNRSDNRTQGFAAQWDFATGRGEVYTIGGAWVTDKIESSNAGNHDTDHWGVYAQDQWQAGSWSAVGAIRSDTHSVFGQQTTPSLSIGWAAGGWKLWGGWARGSRVPSFDDLYRNEQYFQGDPELKLETSESFDGGIEMGGTGGHVRVSTFRRSVSNLILWADADGDRVYRPGNLAQARIIGYEAEVLYRPSPTLSIPVGCQFLSFEDQATGERIPGSVRSLWRAAIQSTGGSFTWSVEYAATDRGTFQFRDGAWNYGIVNAALAWHQKMGSVPVQISLRGENLQDRAYETVEGYPQRGRSWFAEVKVGI